MKEFQKEGVQSSKKLTYISLFTGIGGFEVGIERAFPNAKCLGYAEIDRDKTRVYSKHFPKHNNLGDIFNLKSPLKSDLLVGGFSCKSKSVLSYTKSRQGKCDISLVTFEGTLDIIKNGQFKDIVLENVPTTGTSNLSTEIIKKELEKACQKKIYTIQYDIKDMTGGHRNRVFFTTFPLSIPTEPYEYNRRMEFNLDPYETVRNGTPRNYPDSYSYKQKLIKTMGDGKTINRWGFISDSRKKHAGALTTKHSTWPMGLLFDRRGGDPHFRQMTVGEGERFLGFPEGYLNEFPITIAFKGLGDSVSPLFVYHLMKCLILERKYKVIKVS
jgi:site-specific DNA-cytosine methylase